MSKTGWNWLVTLLLATAVIVVVFFIFMERFRRWGLGNSFGM